MNQQLDLFTPRTQGQHHVEEPGRADHPLPDLRGKPPASGTDTSIAQSDRIRGLPKTKRDEERLLIFLTERGEQGATDDEIKWKFGWDGDYERPRRWQLVQQKKVMPSSKRRKTKDGNPATVWVEMKVYLAKFADECLENAGVL